MVPVVPQVPEAALAVGVEKANSTVGVRCLAKSLPISPTCELKYGRLYWSVNPQLNDVTNWSPFHTACPGVVVLISPVIANGRRTFMLVGRAPKPRPTSSTGEYMFGEPTCAPFAVPPQLTLKPTEAMNSS